MFVLQVAALQDRYRCISDLSAATAALPATALRRSPDDATIRRSAQAPGRGTGGARRHVAGRDRSAALLDVFADRRDPDRHQAGPEDPAKMPGYQQMMDILGQTGPDRSDRRHHRADYPRPELGRLRSMEGQVAYLEVGEPAAVLPHPERTRRPTRQDRPDRGAGAGAGSTATSTWPSLWTGARPSRMDCRRRSWR